MAQLFDPSVMNIYANQGNQMMQGLFQNKQREYSQAHDLDRMNLQNQFQIDSEGRTWDRTKPYMDEQQEIMRKWMAMYEKMLGGQARPAVPSSAGQNTWPTAAGGGYGGTTTGGGYGGTTTGGGYGGGTGGTTYGGGTGGFGSRRQLSADEINYRNAYRRALHIASDLGNEHALAVKRGADPATIARLKRQYDAAKRKVNEILYVKNTEAGRHFLTQTKREWFGDPNYSGPEKRPW